MEAKDVVKEGKAVSPLFDYAASNPVARAPSSLVKGKPDEASVPLSNSRYEQFCQLMAYPDDMGRHRKAYEAYQAAFRDKNGGFVEPATARVNASRLRAKHPEIDARIKFLDAELKAEVMLHKGSIYAETVNEVAGVMRAMSSQRSDPKAASVLVNAAKVLLDATGNQPQMVTETTVAAESSDGLGSVRAAIAKVISVTGAK